jgi:hypothetical protein
MLPKGYIAIMTVLALLVFSLSLLLALPYLSIGGAKQALLLGESEGVRAGLDGCAEDALLMLKRNETYAGGTYEYLGMRCEVEVSRTDARFTLTLTGNGYDITRHLTVAVDRTAGDPGILTDASFLPE